MIETLRISGLAIVEQAELEFGPGLNVLTGETGAGKSIVLSALALLGGGPLTDEVKVPPGIKLLRSPLGSLMSRVRWREKMEAGQARTRRACTHASGVRIEGDRRQPQLGGRGARAGRIEGSLLRSVRVSWRALQPRSA